MFLIEIWKTSNSVFSRGVSLGAKVLITSFYLYLNCYCATSIFVVTLVFRLSLERSAEIVLSFKKMYRLSEPLLVNGGRGGGEWGKIKWNGQVS